MSKKPLRSELWPSGVAISRAMFRKQVLDHAAAMAGVPALRIHDFRASNISWLLSEGMDVPAVMERVGHVQMTTTQRYEAAMNVDQKALMALAKTRGRNQLTQFPGPALTRPDYIEIALSWVRVESLARTHS